VARVTEAERADFWKAVDEASRKAIWCALATVEGGAPRVRIVHPTWDGDVLWFATAPQSPKAKQIAREPRVDVQYQVAPPDFVHVLVRGRAELCSDDATRRHAWDVIDYDLGQFWPGGPADPSYVAVRIVPDRVELSKTFGSQEKRVWTRRP
jgi:general stress protein 26